MSNRLLLTAERKPYPHDDMRYPAEIRLTVETPQGRITLLERFWDAADVVEWFVDNGDGLREPVPPFFDVTLGSIAQAIQAIDNDNRPIEDHEITHDYRFRHYLGNAFSGVRDGVPMIIIGVGPDGGEISCCDEGENWRYAIDLDDLMAQVEQLRRVVFAQPR